ncbi:MAG: Alanine transaminase, partial [uncultured Nocardioides sp.]
ASNPPEPEAPRCPVRRAGADPRRGPAARGRGPPRAQAQHRQHRAVRLRRTRADPRRHDAPPAGLPGLQRLPGDLVGEDGGDALLPVPRPARRRRRGRLHRQRCLRADLDGAAGLRGRRQRDPRPRPRLPPVDGGGHPGGRHAGALPVRRGRRLEPRPGGRRVQDHREHPRPGDHQPQQPDRGGLRRGHGQGAGRHRPPPPARGDGGRDLREDPLRGRPAPPRGDVRRQRRAVPDLLRPVQGLPRVRLPRGLGDDLGPQGDRHRLPRGADPHRQHAHVRQRARAARDPDGARRLPVGRGAHRPRRTLLRAVDARRPAARRDPRRQQRDPARCALLLPAAGPGGLPRRGRPAARPRPVAGQEDPGHPRHRLQLARARPLPAGDAAGGGGARGGDRTDRRLPRHPSL